MPTFNRMLVASILLPCVIFRMKRLDACKIFVTWLESCVLQNDILSMGLDLIASSQDAYSIYSPSRKRLLLLMCCCAYFLFPLSDTMLLPQLQPIAQSMGASSTVVTASVSLYLVACGVGLLVWGPVVDWCGRLPTIHTVLAIFIATSTGCALAPSMPVLLACRCMQGLVASGTWAVSNAVVADIFHPEQRGMAFGVLLMPSQLGPIVAPFLGASLGQAFGWRSTLWFLVGLGAITQIGVILVYRETQHQRVIAKINHKCRSANQEVPAWAMQDNLGYCEHQNPGGTTPWLHNTWTLMLRLMREMTLLPFALMIIHMFACQFVLLVQLPEQLTAAGMSSLLVGISYLGIGLCSMFGSITGGWVSDRAVAGRNSAAVHASAAGAATLRTTASIADAPQRHEQLSSSQADTSGLTQHKPAQSAGAMAPYSCSALHSVTADNSQLSSPGLAADRDCDVAAGKQHAGIGKTARVEFACWLNLLLMPAGLLLFGWTGGLMPKAAVIATSLVGSCMATFCYSFLCPGVFAHVSNETGAQAGTAGALVPAGMNSWAGVVTQLNPLAHASIGTAVLDTIFAASVFPLAAFALGVCFHERRKCSCRCTDALQSPGQEHGSNHALEAQGTCSRLTSEHGVELT